MEDPEIDKGTDVDPNGTKHDNFRDQEGLEMAALTANSFTHQPLQNVIGTEVLIDTLLTKLGHAEDELKEWPPDANFNEHVKKNLSYSKLANEMNHREMRKTDANGVPQPMSICGAQTGSHSDLAELRKSDFKPMGEGVDLYFKMLGCLTCVFFIISVISVPPVIVYFSGEG